MQVFFTNTIGIAICLFLFPQHSDLNILLSDPAFILKYLCLICIISVGTGVCSFFLSKHIQIYTEIEDKKDYFMKHNIHNITNYILGSLFLCIACTLPIGVVFCIQTYGQMDISMLLFLAISPLEGSNMEPFIRIIVLALVSMLIICTLGILLAKRANIPGSFVIQIGKHAIRFPFRNIHRFYAL